MVDADVDAVADVAVAEPLTMITFLVRSSMSLWIPLSFKRWPFYPSLFPSLSVTYLLNSKPANMENCNVIFLFSI